MAQLDTLFKSHELNASSLISDTNLRLYFRFEDASGTTIADSSGNSNTGTASRSAILPQAAGFWGNKATFASGSSDKITVTDASNLKPTGNFSIGAWIKTSTTGVNQMIIQSYSANTNIAGLYMLINTSNAIEFLIGKNTGTTSNTDYKAVDGSINVCDGIWHHVVCVYDGSNMYIYVDSTLDTSVAWANAPAFAATNYVRVGCQNNSGSDTNFFNGDMDDVFLFNGTALTLTQIKTLSGGPVSYYKFENGVTDSGPDGYDLSPQNTPTYGAGIYGQGINMASASSQFANKPNSGGTALNQINGVGSFTWMCWVKPTTLVSYQVLMNKRNNDATHMVGFILSADNGGELYFECDGLSTAQINSGATNLTTGTYYHLAAVYDKIAATIKLYINGNLVGSASSLTGTLSQVNSSGGFCIGTGADGSNQYINGQVDDAAIFNRPLSSTEIASIASQSSPSASISPSASVSPSASKSPSSSISPSSSASPSVSPSSSVSSSASASVSPSSSMSPSSSVSASISPSSSVSPSLSPSASISPSADYVEKYSDVTTVYVSKYPDMNTNYIEKYK